MIVLMCFGNQRQHLFFNVWKLFVRGYIHIAYTTKAVKHIHCHKPHVKLGTFLLRHHNSTRDVVFAFIPVGSGFRYAVKGLWRGSLERSCNWPERPGLMLIVVKFVLILLYSTNEIRKYVSCMIWIWLTSETTFRLI